MDVRFLINKSLVRAYLTFFVCIIVFYTLLRTSIMREIIGHPLALAFAAVSGFILNLLSLKTTASGTLLQVEGFAARVDDVCTGVFVVAIYCAAVLAYPSQIKEKLKGVLLGTSVIFSLNLIRVVSLMFIGRFFPSFFETAHLLIWQSLIIFAALLAWIYWTERFVSAPQH
ncbi:MAG TPA: exosortase H [Verrucomicrobiae bacterium]|nr:exosortase H [Verrucomicrobiae bacterium]